MNKTVRTATDVFEAQISGELNALPEPVRYQMGQTLMGALKRKGMKASRYDAVSWAMMSVLKSQRPSKWLQAKHKQAFEGALGLLGEDWMKAVLADKQIPNDILKPYLREFAHALTDCYGIRKVHFYFYPIAQELRYQGYCAERTSKRLGTYACVGLDSRLEKEYFKGMNRPLKYLLLTRHELAHVFHMECRVRPEVTGVGEVDHRWLIMANESMSMDRFSKYWFDADHSDTFMERDANAAEHYAEQQIRALVGDKRAVPTVA